MKLKINNQNILIAVIAVAAIGLGVYFYNRQKKKNSENEVLESAISLDDKATLMDMRALFPEKDIPWIDEGYHKRTKPIQSEFLVNGQETASGKFIAEVLTYFPSKNGKYEYNGTKNRWPKEVHTNLFNIWYAFKNRNFQP